MSTVYTYFTKEVVDEFGGSGSESLLQILEGLPENENERELIVAQLFTELLLIFEEDQLELDPIVQFLYSIITSDMYARVFCQVLNVFPPSDKTNNLILLLSRKDQVIKPDTIAAYIGADLLKEAGVVPKEVLTKTLNSRVRDEFYTQKKYNLFHEEVEGYSKLIVELYSIMKSSDTEYQVDYCIQMIEKLIGHYSLDPNRCLDIILEVYSSMFVSNVEFSLQLLKKSRWWPKYESDCSSMETLSLGGSEAGAKILGLKFIKYPKEKDLPETFKILIAFLIKEGFVSFGSIYKYLRPEEEEMQILEKEYKKNLDEKVSKSGASALALAAPLADDEEEETSGKITGKQNTATVTESISIEKRLHSNFKYQMLRVFLGNGLYWPSMFILTKYHYLAFIDDEIYPLINRMLDTMIQPLYSHIKPFSDQELTNFQASVKNPISRQHNHISYEDFQITEFVSFKPNIKSYGQKRFTYFYKTWSSDLPKINDVDSLLAHSGDILKFVGVYLSKNVEVFIKLCEIIKWDLTIIEKNPEDENLLNRKIKWFHYFRNYIFPAMSIIEENSIAIENAYSILEFYPIEDRFSVYGELYQILSKNNPYIKMAYNQAEKSTKDILRRLSKENVRSMMRRLAKISFSNPLPCLLTILQQIESYDNLIPLVIETARYFNNYGWDSLTIGILIRLTVDGRSTIQINGMNERKWLQSLASFIGKISQRYPNFIDLETILTFLLKSFHQGDSLGVIVLREILTSMGGLQSINNLTLRQINMINCGSSLEKLVYKTIDDVRYDRAKSGQTLVNTLIKLDGINEILVLLYQLTKKSIAGSELTQLKILASKNDDLDSVIHLLITLINFFGNADEISKHLLSASELNEKYGLSIQWIFELWRPILAKRQLAYETNDSSMETDSPWNPVLQPVMNEVSHVLPAEITSHLSPGLFVTFWQLSLYDINYTSELYDNEESKLKSTIKSLKESSSINSKDKDISRVVLERAKKELKQNEDYLTSIPVDKTKHSDHYDSVVSRLKKESAYWFPISNPDDIKIQTQRFLQYCLLPRSIHSSFDAGFSSKFLFSLHELGANNFSILSLLDELIRNKILFSTLFTLTPVESENLGLFFADILNQLHNWTDEKFFEGNVKSKLFSNDGSEVSYDDYRKILYEYHDIILSDIGASLKVTEYMSRRNAITFLKNLLGVYPNVEDHCEEIVKLIQNIATTEQREDLKLSSSALIGHVKSRSKEWVHLWDFIPMPEAEKEALIKKRKEEKEKELAKIRAKQIKEQKEKEEALRKQREEEEKKKRKNLLNYDSKQSVSVSTSSARNDIRGESSRGRYDNYSNYDNRGTQDDKLRLKEDNKKEISNLKDQSTATRANDDKKADSKKAENKKDDLKGDSKIGAKSETKIDLKVESKGDAKSEPKNLNKQDSIKNESNDKKTEEKSADLKARLLQAKKDYQEKASKEQREPASRSRAPLPPQGSLPKDAADQRYGGRYNDNYNISSSRFSRDKSSTPNPPQRPHRPHTSQYDRKVPTPSSYPERKSTPTNSNKPPVPPPSTKPPASNLSYQERNKQPTRAGLPPPPPPPPPPVSLKPRSDNFQKRNPRPDTYDNRGDSYQSRDGYNRGEYRYEKGAQGRPDNKRPLDYNRGYNKKSRY
ncbi:uncharacterized protein CANTADRAFT_25030 [Suhomyces tanzawaensis NRRL Y-17324]|uniref:THO complex subunit 2 n=1 Tax=Suhomyces tanzawaensis NRRL Y-17324 TaxID=984487 RepID=A0A1E4SLW5_9ASCO|nr:uncharacterized protein CANTADRAFT_25030 [Suhomyces tanzawaensis NRRL Y-17324]ODV80516.1 hypothetical protein CANTADRAFT_25030 [Suhomyces tanzawaensis NRRL Y-17324]